MQSIPLIPTPSGFFSEAVLARHLIRLDRLSDEERTFFDDDAPEELLHQYIVLNYADIPSAKIAVSQLRFKRGVRDVHIDKTLNLSWVPNDPYFAIDSLSAGFYQWGMRAMNFPQAWDKTRGHGYVGVIDAGLPSPILPDLQQNYRPHLSPLSVASSPSTYKYHGAHVMGIISATANNSVGVSGGCPGCSTTMVEFYSFTASAIAETIRGMYRNGMQVLNISAGRQFGGCASYQGFGAACVAINEANNRDVLIVAAAGNYDETQPDYPAGHSFVLAVGGAENTDPGKPNPFNWVRWFYGYDSVYNENVGSNHTGIDGVMGPAKSIVSTVDPGSVYFVSPSIKCSDILPEDESGVSNDGYGSCTGTSMAAPHISALAGILRSINPRLPHSIIQDIIRASGTASAVPNSVRGYVLARANLAVDSAIVETPNRLTPLFSLFSWGRRDFLMTTVPQMASAATWGTLQPANFTGTAYRYISAGGLAITGYDSYPGAYSDPNYDYVPKAGAWIFTTSQNPKSPSTPLVPLYRLSWKCGDFTPYPPVICATVPGHMDTAHTADPAGVITFQSWGYKLDGIEGYISPKTVTQPLGTVRLMRKYNPQRDDHAIFPETELGYFGGLGYTENSGSDWLGYVYPNSTGSVPVIQ